MGWAESASQSPNPAMLAPQTMGSLWGDPRPQCPLLAPTRSLLWGQSRGALGMGPMSPAPWDEGHVLLAGRRPRPHRAAPVNHHVE